MGEQPRAPCWATENRLGDWEQTISPIIWPHRRHLARGKVPSSRMPPKMTGRAVGSSPLISRPLRVWENVEWRLESGPEGAVTSRWGDWGAWVGGHLRRTAALAVLGAPSWGRLQSQIWGGTPQPCDGSWSRSSEPCSGSPQVFWEWCPRVHSLYN